MSEEKTTTEETKKDAPAVTKPRSPRGGAGSAGGRGPQKGGRRGRPPREPREFEQKIIDIRRVVRVVAGGRRFGFSVAMVLGDANKKRVGVGLGKAGDTALAIQKAVNHAKKNMVTLNLNEDSSIPHEVEAKYNAATLMLTPNGGRGVVAGSAVRSILELAGVRDVTSKIFSRSKNKLNIARATIKALSPFILKKNQKATPKKEEEKPDEEAK